MAGAGASTFTVTTVEALSWRSSKAVARTAMGPGPASVVSSVAWFRLEESLPPLATDRKSTRLNSSHANISYAVFCLKKKRWRGKHEINRHRYWPKGARPALIID